MTTAYFKPMKFVGCSQCEMPASPEGPSTWDIGELSDLQAAQLNCHFQSCEQLRFHPNAPDWVRVWDGPYEIYVYND